MNILHVMGMDSTKYGGIEKYNVELTRQLNDINSKVIFVYESMPQSENFLKDIDRSNSKLIVLNSRNNIFLYLLNIYRLIKQEKIDIVHCHFTKARFYVIPLSILMKKKCYFTIHSLLENKNEMKFHTRFWYDICVKKTSIICVSKAIENMAKFNWPNADINQIYLGVQHSTNCNPKDLYKRNNIIMCTANFNYIKGLDVLCEALVKIKNIVPDIKLIIVGQPNEEIKELKSLIDSLKLNDNVEMIGITDNVSKYLDIAKIYVQPSRSEGLGLSIVEAVMKGLPIVASNVGGIPEVVENGKNGYLFENENANDLANKVLEILNNENIYRKLVRYNEIIASRFSLYENVKKMIEQYKLDGLI